MFSSGFSAGANATTNVINSANSRQIAQEKLKMEKDAWEAERPKREAEGAAYQHLTQKLEKQEAEIQKQKGQIVNSKATQYLGSFEDSGQNLQSLNFALQDPDTLAALGKQEGYHLRSLNVESPEDRKLIEQKLTTMGVDWSRFNEEEATDILNNVNSSGFFLAGNDGEVVDMNDFMMTSGAYKSATGKEAKIISERETKLRESLQATFDKSEFRMKEEEANKKLQDQIKIEQGKQYQTSMEILGKSTAEGKGTQTAKVQEYNALVESGMSHEEARQKVWKDDPDKMITADQAIMNIVNEQKIDLTTDEGIEKLANISKAFRGKVDKPKTDTELAGERRVNAITFNRKYGLDKKGKYISDAMIDEALKANIVNDKRADATKTIRKDLGSLSNAMSKMGNFRNLVEKDTYERDVIEKGIDYIRSIDPTDFSKMSKSQQQNHIDKVFANSYGGQILADYMKSISGTAIADAEYKRLLKIFEGDSWSNKDTYLAAIEGFSEGIEDTVENGAMGIQTDNPVESMLIRRQVQESRASRWKKGDPVPEGYKMQKNQDGTKFRIVAT